MKLKYDPSKSSVNILLDNSCDPNLHFFNTSIRNLDTPYILPKEFQNFLDDDISESLSILLLNIRSMKKNFETFKNFLSTVNYNFSIICFCETWLDETNMKIQTMNFQVIIVYIKLEIIAKGVGSQHILKSHVHNETVMYIMHCREYHLHNCSRDSHLHNYNKNSHPLLTA